MRAAYFLMAAALTSLVALALGRRVLGLRPGALGSAVARALETIGLVTLFALADLAVGVGVAIALRATGSGFVSLYIMVDPTWLGLPLLQGLAFQWWRETGRR